MIGQASATQRIMSLEALESGRITHASQDGNREFISLLACIGADGTALPPALIYKGDSGILQDTWVEDVNPNDEAFFAVSAKGWSCDILGLNWLEQVFQRYTKQKARNRRRLLIVDGHSSHVNLKFIDKCDNLRILLLILPSHSTHRLQPLDVSLFAPLATFYTNGLNRLMFESLGMINMSNRAFWSVFFPAWQQAFSEEKITSAFEKTGIWPYNPSLILNVITPQIIEAPSQSPKTPMTSRAIRRTQRAYDIAPTNLLLAKIFRANERLAAQDSINKYVIKGLCNTLQDEKKRRKRGKRLNLVGEEDSGPQFFSPRRVQAAREFQAAKEEEEAQRQLDISEKRRQATAKRLQKEEEKLAKVAIALEKRRLTAEAKVAKAAEKQAQKELRKTANRYPKGQLGQQKQYTGSNKVQKTRKKKVKPPTRVIIAKEVEEVVLTTSTGRRVQRPGRFAM